MEKTVRGMGVTEVRRRLCTLIDEVAEHPIAIMRDGKLVALISKPPTDLKLVLDEEKKR